MSVRVVGQCLGWCVVVTSCCAMPELQADFKAKLAALTVPVEIQEALKIDDMTTAEALVERCASEVVLGKWFLCRVVKENKVKDLTEENWEFSKAWSALRSAWTAFKESCSTEPEAKATAKGAKVDEAKRAMLVKKFEGACAGSYFGSRRTSPSNRLLERCLDMMAGGKDSPGKYLRPSQCTSVLDEEAEDKVKADKLEKASYCFLPLYQYTSPWLMCCCVRTKRKRKRRQSLDPWV